MTGYNIKADALSDDDAIRLAARNPKLGIDIGPYDYCPTCNKTGFYRWRGEDHECDCFLQLQLHKHYLNSGVGITYQRLDWEDWFAEPEMVQRVRDIYLVKPYIDRGMGLFLWGGQGTGKTMLATLAIKELIKRGLRCYAITMDSLIDEFTKGWVSDDDRRWFERKIKYSEVLLMDDIGKEGGGKLPERTFNNLLRERVQGGRPTLITTNISPQEVGYVYGSNSLRMLYESAMEISFSGVDVSLEINQRSNTEMEAGEIRPIV